MSWQRCAQRCARQAWQSVLQGAKSASKPSSSAAAQQRATAAARTAAASSPLHSATYQAFRASAACGPSSASGSKAAWGSSRAFSFASAGLPMASGPRLAPMTASIQQQASQQPLSSSGGGLQAAGASSLSTGGDEDGASDDDEPGTNYCCAGSMGRPPGAYEMPQASGMPPIATTNHHSQSMFGPVAPSGSAVRLHAAATTSSVCLRQHQQLRCFADGASQTGQGPRNPAGQQQRRSGEEGDGGRGRRDAGRAGGREGGRDERRGGRFEMSLQEESLEFKVAVKDAFMHKSLPVPQGVREVMYAHRWDKLLVDVRRAVHLVKDKGKVEEYTAMVAVGNMKGLFGLGLADAATAQEAVAAAHLKAYSHLQVVPLYREHTIFHPLEHRYHWIKMKMSPCPSGSGIVANDLLTELCNLVGIKDIYIKVHANRLSRLFLATAFKEALQKQTVPHDGIEASGVYLQEVYHKKMTPMKISLTQQNSRSSVTAAA